MRYVVSGAGTAVNPLINLCRHSILPEVPLHPCLGAGLLLLLEETKSTRGFKNWSHGTNGNDWRAAVLGSVSLGGRRGKPASLSLAAWFALHRDSLVPDVKTLCTNLRFPLKREKSRKLKASILQEELQTAGITWELERWPFPGKRIVTGCPGPVSPEDIHTSDAV